MKGRALMSAAAICAPAICGMARAQTSTLANRAAALFDKYCLSEAPKFSRLDRQVGSEKEKHEVVLDRTMPMGKGGQFMHQKNWVIPRRRGKPPLTSADVANGPLHVFGCGLAVIDGDAAELETALSANPRLGKPVKRVAEARRKCRDGCLAGPCRRRLAERGLTSPRWLLICPGLPA